MAEVQPLVVSRTLPCFCRRRQAVRRPRGRSAMLRIWTAHFRSMP